MACPSELTENQVRGNEQAEGHWHKLCLEIYMKASDRFFLELFRTIKDAKVEWDNHIPHHLNRYLGNRMLN